MKNDRLIPLMLNGKFDTIENQLTYRESANVDADMREDIRKLVGEGIEILPDTDTVTGEPIIRVYGLEPTDSEEYSSNNWQ